MGVVGVRQNAIGEDCQEFGQGLEVRVERGMGKGPVCTKTTLTRSPFTIGNKQVLKLEQASMLSERLPYIPQRACRCPVAGGCRSLKISDPFSAYEEQLSTFCNLYFTETLK